MEMRVNMPSDSADAKGSLHVKIKDARSQSLLHSLSKYDPFFNHGVTIASNGKASTPSGFKFAVSDSNFKSLIESK